MATVTLQRANIVQSISGNSPQTLIFPEAASQTYKTGELVYLVAGKVTEIGDNAAVILGMAAEDASGTTNTDAPVYVFNSDSIFELNKVTSNTTAGAGATGAVTALTDVGTCFGIRRDTTNNIVHACNNGGFGNSTNERLLCIALSKKDTVGDTGGRLLCMVIGRYRQLFATS